MRKLHQRQHPARYQLQALVLFRQETTGMVLTVLLLATGTATAASLCLRTLALARGLSHQNRYPHRLDMLIVECQPVPVRPHLVSPFDQLHLVRCLHRLRENTHPTTCDGKTDGRVHLDCLPIPVPDTVYEKLLAFSLGQANFKRYYENAWRWIAGPVQRNRIFLF
jgi:hypothetical protein